MVKEHLAAGHKIPNTDPKGRCCKNCDQWAKNRYPNRGGDGHVSTCMKDGFPTVSNFLCEFFKRK